MNLYSFLAVTLWAWLAVSGQTPEASEPGLFRGVLLNEQCATRQPEWLPYADEHSIDCAMLPICFLSGYYLVIDEDDIVKLDRRGELLARALLQNTEKQSGFRVIIRGEIVDSILSVHAIGEAS